MTIIIDLGSSAVKAGFALEDGRYGDLLCIYFKFVPERQSVVRSLSRSLGCLVVGTFWLFGSFGWSFGCLFVFIVCLPVFFFFLFFFFFISFYFILRPTHLHQKHLKLQFQTLLI